ncbi:FAD-dependent oxidoreductase [Micromonospora sp. NPDC005203]|uniref:FAD-dependent oxidoreductase n=1 Tax=Micromonospora sp. NPDC005203 TaxID=3364226 RepID=UPI0036A7D2DA
MTGAGGATTSLSARHAVVIATGTSALVPDIAGLREAAPWTSRAAAAASEVPGRLAIIGGGVVAAEMATACAGLGAPVDADEILVAIGRTPNTHDVGLYRVGLEPGARLAVDDTLRVLDGAGALAGDGWLYAAGDVNRRVLLTHQGKYQARAVGDVIVARAGGEAADDRPWGRHVATADERAVPQVVFTDPEVASVGLTAAAAEAAGLRIRVVDYDLAAVAGSALTATRGMPGWSWTRTGG